MSNGYVRLEWEICAHCHMPYRIEDLVAIPLAINGISPRYVCGWHYEHGCR